MAPPGRWRRVMRANASKSQKQDEESPGSTNPRTPRSLRSLRTFKRPSTPDSPDAEVVHGKWANLLSVRRRRKANTNAFDLDEGGTSPILSTPGASGDCDGGLVPPLSPDVHHLCASDAPMLSAKAAAIAAWTIEEHAREMEEEHARNLAEHDLSDRPEAAKMAGPAAVAKKRRAEQSRASGTSWSFGTLGLVSVDALNGYSNDEFGLSENWLVNRDDIKLGKTIGHSSFGTVCEGRLNGTKVAVKTIKRDANGDGARVNYDDIAKEAEFNCRLRHPNIVLFMGISLQLGEVCIVTELMARGNVRDLLVPNATGKQLKLELSLRMQWALDTAQGMAYLHSLNPPMIHRDLKTTNLLVDRGMNVKICDFGLSRFQAEDKIMTAVGTVQFAAPEVLRHEPYNEKVDLFSYGTVLWELYTRTPVFDRLPQLQVYKAVIEGDMPTVDEKCNPEFRSLMRDCWSADPENRPSFQEVIVRLSELVDDQN